MYLLSCNSFRYLFRRAIYFRVRGHNSHTHTHTPEYPCHSLIGPNSFHEVRETALVGCVTICSVPNLYSCILQTPHDLQDLLIITHILHGEVGITAIFKVGQKLWHELTRSNDGRFAVVTQIM